MKRLYPKYMSNRQLATAHEVKFDPKNSPRHIGFALKARIRGKRYSQRQRLHCITWGSWDLLRC